MVHLHCQLEQLGVRFPHSEHEFQIGEVERAQLLDFLLCASHHDVRVLIPQ